MEIKVKRDRAWEVKSGILRGEKRTFVLKATVTATLSTLEKTLYDEYASVHQEHYEIAEERKFVSKIREKLGIPPSSKELVTPDPVEVVIAEAPLHNFSATIVARTGRLDALDLGVEILVERLKKSLDFLYAYQLHEKEEVITYPPKEAD